MLNLRGITYDAVVVASSIDPGKHGAIRVKVYGLTDSLEDEMQPQALPIVSSMTAVPTVGSIVSIYFEDGDIHQPKYTHVSASTRALPDDYIKQYPNVSYSNLGGDDFFMVHDRANRSTIMSHPSNSTITWDDTGKVTHDSDLGSSKAGIGAKDGTGNKIQSVLTGGTVDIFSATPFGSPQGSAYFEVTHMSGGIINRNSSLDAPIVPVETTAKEQSILDGETIDYSPSTNIVETSDRVLNDINTLYVAHSNGTSFITTVDNITSGSNDASAHYVIDTDASIVQCVDLKFASQLGSLHKNENDEAYNINSISVIVTGNSYSFTDNQINKINQIIRHMKSLNGGDVVEVVHLSGILLHTIEVLEDERIKV